MTDCTLDFGRDSAKRFLNDSVQRVRSFSGKNCNKAVDLVLSQMNTVLQNTTLRLNTTNDVIDVILELRIALIGILKRVQDKVSRKEQDVREYFEAECSFIFSPQERLSNVLQHSAAVTHVYLKTSFSYGTDTFELFCWQDIHRMLLEFQSQIDNVTRKIDNFSPQEICGFEIVVPVNTQVPRLRKQGGVVVNCTHPSKTSEGAEKKIDVTNQDFKDENGALVEQVFASLRCGCTRREIIDALKRLGFQEGQGSKHPKMFINGCFVTVPQEINHLGMYISFKGQVKDALLGKNYKGARKD